MTRPGHAGTRNGRHAGGILVARPDNVGDVLLAGPAVRAAAATGRPVHLLCGPRGRAAAELLPGVTEVIEHLLPWIEPDRVPVLREDADRLVAEVRDRRITDAAILASSHQSPLPLALLLRWAGVERIAAVSHEHAGSLLDHRVPGDPDVHEVTRGLLVTDALGLPRPADDRLAVDLADPEHRDAGLVAAGRAGGRSRNGRRADPVLPPELVPDRPYVVVHPGASVPARTLAPVVWRHAVAALVHDGWSVVVTGTPGEARLAGRVSGDHPRVLNLAGRTTLRGLARLLAAADAVAAGNTGPVHLAAAVGTPVALAYAPTVPLDRWRPWRVPHEVLGEQHIACAGCRSQVCPHPRQTCLLPVTGRAVADAVARVARPSPVSALLEVTGR